MATTTLAERSKVMWRMKLHSAFRTAVACTIVGCTTLYGPSSLSRHIITFPAFSYVTAILIVSDANLGDTLRGFWHAFYATVQVVPLSMLTLRLVGPSRFSPSIAALAVAVTSFLVGLPESTHLMSKRIAFGQLVIVYVDAVIHRNHNVNAMMHPLHVAASTALGATSALLALLLPYPRLAYCEVRKLCRLYAENASERMNLYLKATTAESNVIAVELISKAKPLAETGNKLLQSINLMQEGILWERPWIRSSKTDYISPGDRLQGLEIPMRGMEIALKCSPPLPAGLDNQGLSDILLGASALLCLEQARCFLPFNSMTVPESKTELINKIISPNETILSMNRHPAACFFLSCAQQFIDNSTLRQIPETIVESSVAKREKPKEPQEPIGIKEMYGSWIVKLNNERLLFALKCSLSLGLAVLIGLTFNKENGYWSGLTIAISFVVGRQAIFTVANARAQGTAIGSVYGVLGCFIFREFPEIRFLALLPWIFFTNFLRHSRMYGQAGGISAVIGALLILGRNNYGLPNEFAIARLTEAIIGLCCFIFVELLLQPTRAATLAKKQLNLSLVTLQECMRQIVLSSGNKDQPSMVLKKFREKLRDLKSQVNDLENFLLKAELEPNFWFLPFRGSCYKKLHDSLSDMADLLQCMTHSLEFMLQDLQNLNGPLKEFQEHISNGLEVCRENLSSSLRCLGQDKLTPSFEVIQKPQEEKIFQDLEMGSFPAQNMLRDWRMEDQLTVNNESYFLQQLKKVADSIRDGEDEEQLKGNSVLTLSALGYSISCLMRETKETERGIKELTHWENPSSQ